MKDARNRREHRQKNKQIQKRLTGLNRANGERADHADPDVRNHTGHPETKGHRQAAFVRLDVFEQLKRRCHPAQTLGFDDRICRYKFSRLAKRRPLDPFGF